MISKEDFIKTINTWEARFTTDILEVAYDTLDSENRDKQYVIGIVDTDKEDFYFDYMCSSDLIKIINAHIKAYRNDITAYLPRILIINLFTRRIYKDPTEWGIFAISR